MMRALYDALAPRAMGVCMRYCESREEAEDVMQDGFVKVFERIGQVADAEKVEGWAMRVMVNECLMHYRKRRVRMKAEQGYATVQERVDLDPYGAEEIVEALQQLPTLQRVAFNLCEVEGYSSDEAAQLMHCKAGAVRVNLYRARQRLKEKLNRI